MNRLFVNYRTLGSAYKVIVDSSDIQELLRISRGKITTENISYAKEYKRQPKIVDGQILTVRRENSIYYLFKGSRKII